MSFHTLMSFYNSNYKSRRPLRCKTFATINDVIEKFAKILSMHKKHVSCLSPYHFHFMTLTQNNQFTAC